MPLRGQHWQENEEPLALQLLPPVPRIPQPQKMLQHELPHEPQLLLELSWVLQSVGSPPHAPHPAWHPEQVPSVWQA
jgi:hypothetical protein